MDQMGLRAILQPVEQNLDISDSRVILSFRSPRRFWKWANSGRRGTAIRGGAWSITGYVGVQLLRTTATLVLARQFLGPEPFGLIGLVAVFISGLSMFSEFGLVANIVQHPRGDESDFLNTAFSVQALRGLAIWLVSVAAAYPMAIFYKQPQLVPLLTVAALSEAVRGLTSTAAWTLTRHMKLRNITLLAISSEAAASTIGIVWAFLAPSVWALVARTAVGAVVYAFGSHFVAGRRVRFQWSSSAARDILHFGGWISLATAAHFLGSQGERLILGKVVTPAELGCFSLALMISAVPAGGVNQLVSQIFLPMISADVRTSHSETLRNFARARKILFAIAVVTGLGFVFLGKPLVTLLLTSKYAMTAWMLQILGLRVALDFFAAPTSSLVIAYGKTRYAAAANTTRLVCMIVGVWIGFKLFGLREAVISLILAQAISYFPLIVGLRKLLPEAVGTEMRSYGILLAVLCFMAVVQLHGI